MKRTLIAALLLFTTLCATAQKNKGYHINVHIEGLRDTSVLLGYHFGSKMYVADTAIVDSKGQAVFSGDTALHGGIYFVVLPEKKYFELLMTERQQFGIQVKRSDLLKSLKFTGSPENSAFADYQRFMLTKQERNKELAEALKATDDEAKKTQLREQLNTLNAEVEAEWTRIAQKHPGTLIAAVVNSMRPINIPEFDIPAGTRNPDSLRWMMGYAYNRAHYFDHIDLTDSRLLRTPILEQRVDNYFDRVLMPSIDTLTQAAFNIIERTRPNRMMFQYMVQHLTNKFQTSDRMGMDGAFAMLAERYYLSGDAWWADSNLVGRLRERVTLIKPNMLGKTAPDLWMPNQQMRYQRLSEVKAKITVLYFWDPDCGHCKKTTPEVLKIFEKYKNKGMKVFAVYTQGDQPKWMEYTKNNNLNEWTHVWDPNIGSNFRNLYDISSTPVIYVLNENKKILAKRIGYESLEQILEVELGDGLEKEKSKK